ncbi:MAG: universal stress protein [Gemmatimonadota bacterium]
MSRSIRTLVVGVATLREPDPVLGAALALAARTGAALHVVHAFEVAGYERRRYREMGYSDRDSERLFAGGLQSRLEGQVRALAGRGRVFCSAVRGSPDRVLAAAAERLDADLVVVGSTRRGPLARTLLGTTAQHVLHRVRRPVLMVHPPLRSPVARVLLTTDLSELSEVVHEAGVELVDALFRGDAPELRSLLVSRHEHALPPGMHGAHGDTPAAPALHRFLAMRGPRPRPVEPRVRVGDPAREIAAEAREWDADLLVLGTHARTGAARVLLGSVAEGALRSARCSVLVVPAAAVAAESARLPALEARAALTAS